MKNTHYQTFVAILFLLGCHFGKSGITDPIADNVFATEYNKANAKQVDTVKLPHYQTLVVESKDQKLVKLTTEMTECELPKTASDLKGPFETTVYKFDMAHAASATLFGYSGNIGKNEVLYIRDYTKSVVINCKVAKKYGIGLRYFVLVSQIEKGLPGDLKQTAAASEARTAQASYEIKSLGFWNDRGITKDLPSQGAFDTRILGKFAEINASMENTINRETSMKISPVELPQ
jgi:hypothetical protein